MDININNKNSFMIVETPSFLLKEGYKTIGIVGDLSDEERQAKNAELCEHRMCTSGKIMLAFQVSPDGKIELSDDYALYEDESVLHEILTLDQTMQLISKMPSIESSINAFLGVVKDPLPLTRGNIAKCMLFIAENLKELSFDYNDRDNDYQKMMCMLNNNGFSWTTEQLEQFVAGRKTALSNLPREFSTEELKKVFRAGDLLTAAAILSHIKYNEMNFYSYVTGEMKNDNMFVDWVKNSDEFGESYREEPTK